MNRARVIGEHVYLRPLEREDIDDQYLDWVNDIGLNTYILATGFPVTRDMLIEYYENHGEKAVIFAVCDKQTDTRIGNARLSNIDWVHRTALYGRLLGHPEFRGKGFGSDALIQLLRFGFHHLGLNRIWSAAAVTNEVSLRSNERVGMTTEGVLRQLMFVNGRFYDAVALSMLREDFDRLHGTPDQWIERDRVSLAKMAK